MLLLSDRCNYRLCCTIFEVSSVVKDWHSHQARTLRSSDSSAKWLYDQFVAGEYMQHVKDILNKMHYLPSLEACEFMLTAKAL